MSTEISLARLAAPEDIKPGSYAAVLHEITETLRCRCWLDELPGNPPFPQIVRLQWLPRAEPMPLKVVEVCLRFVLVKTPVCKGEASRTGGGSLRTLDVRRYRLALLPESYGARVFKLLKEKGKAKTSGPSCDWLFDL